MATRLIARLLNTRKVQNLLSPNIDSMLDEIAFDAVALMTEKRTENISQRIYAKPPSKSYRRTGRALGGTQVTKLGNAVYEIEDNTMIKGARRNYSPMLNKNKRIKKLATKYWDDAKKETKKEAGKIMKKRLNKSFKFKLE